MIKEKEKMKLKRLKSDSYHSNNLELDSKVAEKNGKGVVSDDPDFGRSVNPISTRKDRLCPPQYHERVNVKYIFGPVCVFFL